MSDVSGLLRAERLALIEVLEGLTAAEWATPSLCGAWTVQEVGAHLAWAPVQSVGAAAAAMVRSGFRLNTMIAQTAVGWSQRGPDAVLVQLRSNAATAAKPVGMPEQSALVDAVVHSLDIRRPLGRSAPLSEPAFRRTAAFFTGLRWPMTMPIGDRNRGRIARLRLEALDLDWASGQGPEVRGSAESLLLLLAGRPVSADELSGPGVAGLDLTGVR